MYIVKGYKFKFSGIPKWKARQRGVRTIIGNPDFYFAKYFSETLLLGCAKVMQSHGSIDEIYENFFSDVEADKNDTPPGIQQLNKLENFKKEWNRVPVGASPYLLVLPHISRAEKKTFSCKPSRCQHHSFR